MKEEKRVAMVKTLRSLAKGESLERRTEIELATTLAELYCGKNISAEAITEGVEEATRLFSYLNASGVERIKFFFDNLGREYEIPYEIPEEDVRFYAEGREIIEKMIGE